MVTSPRVKVEPVALDLLLLAIHEVDVVAQEQVQILDARARKLELDRIELEQQIVAERTHQGEPRRQGCVKLVDAARAASKRPRAACCVLLPGNSSGSGLRCPWMMPFIDARSDSQCGCGRRTGSSSRLMTSPRAFSGVKVISRPAATISSGGATDATSQREYRSGIFVTGGKIDAAVRIQLAQQVSAQTFVNAIVDARRVTVIPPGVL